MHLLKKTNWLVIICVTFLLIVPFLWLRPGEMDLGGDSSRLYFYDPLSYLKSAALFVVLPQGMGIIEPNFYLIPFLLLLAGLKSVLQSSYLLIIFFNCLKLSVGFLSIYLIIKEIATNTFKHMPKDKIILAGILGGFFYIFSSKIILTWDKALLSHNQVFLNPLLFFLLLRFFTTMQLKYAWLVLATTFLFAPNFALTSAPPFFAFYPLAIVYLLVYVLFIVKRKILWRKVFLVMLLLLGLHFFHLIPQLISLFDKGSFSNTRVFDKESIVHEGVRYFTGVLPLAKASENFLLPSTIQQLHWLSFFSMTLILGGLLIGRHKVLLLTTLFFLITFYLLTANLTEAGVGLYKNLFLIPGFSMFRNFIGQWIFVYTFFYAVLIGITFTSIAKYLSYRILLTIFITYILFLTVGSSQFISGELVNKIHFGSNDVRIGIEMDPAYEEFLQYVRSLPQDGKILTLPLTDSYYQVLSGKNGGAYIGPSTISYIANRKDFYGYQVLTGPFSEELFYLSREGKYDEINRLLGVLNIKYIFLNKDEGIYDNFLSDPYQYSRLSMPKTTKDYIAYIKNLGANLKFQKGNYQLYEVEKKYYLPHFYSPSHEILYKTILNQAKFVEIPPKGTPYVYVDSSQCYAQNCKYTETPNIVYQKINPTKYVVTVSNATRPYMLVFQELFHPSWRIFHESSSKIIQSNPKHFAVNGYANGWLILPETLQGGTSYTLTIESVHQKVFYYSLLPTIITLVVFIAWGMFLFYPRLYTILVRKKYGKK